MDRRLGEPLPHQLSNPTRAHPCAINLWHQKHAISMRYAVLAVVSNCCPPHKGRLLTRYSPVRHWSDPKVVTVRLECVMHAASVHPEPGSNSQTIVYLPLSRLDPVWAIYSSFFYFLELCSLWFWQILYSHLQICFVLLSSVVQLSSFDRSLARACLLYHIAFTLSIPFLKFFQIFFDSVSAPRSLPFSRQLYYYITPPTLCQDLFLNFLFLLKMT